MKLVADTNAFLAVALNEREKGGLIQVTTGYDLIAPDVLPFEIGNALSAMLKKGVLRASEMPLAWDAAQTIPVELCPVDIRASLGLAARFGIYAYDAYFLECALSRRLPLLTLDRCMARVARELSIDVLEVHK